MGTVPATWKGVPHATVVLPEHEQDKIKNKDLTRMDQAFLVTTYVGGRKGRKNITSQI